MGRLAIVALALCGACTRPLPAGVSLDASAAYAVLGVAQGPSVYAVAPDCNDGQPGFWLEGACRGGLSEPDVGIFIPIWQGSRWSHHFAHEYAGHWAPGLPGLDAHHEGPAFQPGGAVDQAKLALFFSGYDEIAAN